MKLRRLPRREHPETVVALIDVVFFLLVFFMMVGRMDATAPFEVTPPLAATGADLPGGGATVAISESGELAMEGAVLDRAALLARLADRLAEMPGLVIRLNAHRATALHHILPLVSDIEALGAKDVVLVVTEGGG